MKLVAGPVLPCPGTSETAGAQSASSGVEVPQPMAGPKRPSEGDPEIAEICFVRL